MDVLKKPCYNFYAVYFTFVRSQPVGADAKGES